MRPRLIYFDEHEFVRAGVAWFPLMDERMLVLLDVLRHRVGKPFIISNSKDALGRHAGSSKSWHNIDQHGNVFAVDGYFERIDTEQQAREVVRIARDIGITGIGLYRDWQQAQYGFHFDARTDRKPGYPATWGRVDSHYTSLTAALEGVA
jgi:hypothetical protein